MNPMADVEALAARASVLAAKAEAMGRHRQAETARWLVDYISAVMELQSRYGWSREIGEAIASAARLLAFLEFELGVRGT